MDYTRLGELVGRGQSVFWSAFFWAALASYPIYRLLLLTKSRQNIDPHAPATHQMKQGTPTMGGLILLVGMIAAMASPLFQSPWSEFQSERLRVFDQRIGFCILFFGFALIGFVDDFVVPRLTGKRGLGWIPKILMQFAIAGWGVHALAGAGGWLDVGLGVFVVLFWANAFNFADGLDGLSGSLLLGLASGFILLCSFRPDSDPFCQGTIGLVGATVVFLAYNAPPAKVFMGDVGSLAVGAFFGAGSFQLLLPGTMGVSDTTSTLPSMLFPLLILSLVMIAELVPVPVQVAYFKLTKGKRLFPSTPIHHGFEKKGWPESRVMWSFALFQLLCSIAAYSIAVGDKP